MLSRLIAYLADAVRHPHEKLTRGQHNVRYAWDLAVHCYQQLMRHRAEGMAAELTYRTIFSLIPVVVLGLVMFRVVGGLQEVQANVENQLYSFFGVPDLPEAYLAHDFETMEDVETEEAVPQQEESSDDPQAGDDAQPSLEAPQNIVDDGVVASTTGTDEDANGQPAPKSDRLDPDQPETDQTEMEIAAAKAESDAADTDREAAAIAARKTRAGIRKALHEITNKVANIDFTSIGFVGLLLFIYAAIALADSVEYLFNRIYEAPTSRPIHLRLAIHWSIITLGSGLLALSLYMSGQALDWFVTVSDGWNVRPFLSHTLSVGAAFVLLFLLYALMPNTDVSVKAAAIGALVGALLWEGAKIAFKIYVVTAVPYSALYGALGMIPLFLFWIYLTWLIVLFGLILTYTLQTLRGKRFVKGEQVEVQVLPGDPDWMLPIMSEVAFAFEQGQAIGIQEVADRLGLTSRVVHDMSGELIEAQILRRVAATGGGIEDALTLGRPADRITVAEILSLAHRTRPASDNPAWKTLDKYNAAQREAAHGKTLADIALQSAT